MRNPIGPMQWLGILLGAMGVFIGSAGLLYLGKNRSENNERQANSNQLDTSTWAIFAVLATVLPVLAWISRNIYLYRTITKANKLFEVILISKICSSFSIYME